MTTAAECRNCGTVLVGAYCSACGQKADVRILSLGRLLADAVGDLYNFDSRIWRSLATLAVKPGRLTRSYLEGQRARYTPPFRMYVVTSVVFFLVFSIVQSAVPSGVGEAGTDPPPRPAVPAPAAVEPAPAADAVDGFGITVDGDNWRCGLDDGMNPRLRARFEAACQRLVEAGSGSFTRALADNIPVMMLVFIPGIAAIMRALYLFAGRKYVEHLLFFVHVHTQFFLIGLITLVLGYLTVLVPFLDWPVWLVNAALWVYFPVYLFMAMRHVYGQSYALTSVKYVVLGGIYLLALMLTLLGVIIYTALTI